MDRTNIRFSVAIDGTAASGKSTVAKLLAEKMACSYLDTGKLYRAISLQFLSLWKTQPDSWANDSEELNKQLESVELEIRTPPSGECRILLGSEDVNDKLADLEVESATPYAARLPQVREYLLDVQRDLAKASSVVMAGRDIGTVVLPDATLKVFIEADLSERARRRLTQHHETFTEQELALAAEALRSRDEKDSSRELAPMVAAPDSLRLDSTDRHPEELVSEIVKALERQIVQTT
jgi:CMP/dCMP kinase